MPDRYGRVHDSESGNAEVGLFRFYGCPTDGFGLYLFVKRQPRPRGMSISPAICVAEFDRRAALSPIGMSSIDSFCAYGRHAGVTSALAIGGVSMGKRVRVLLNGVDVLVATNRGNPNPAHSGPARSRHVRTRQSAIASHPTNDISRIPFLNRQIRPRRYSEQRRVADRPE